MRHASGCSFPDGRKFDVVMWWAGTLFDTLLNIGSQNR